MLTRVSSWTNASTGVGPVGAARFLPRAMSAPSSHRHQCRALVQDLERRPQVGLGGRRVGDLQVVPAPEAAVVVRRRHPQVAGGGGLLLRRPSRLVAGDLHDERAGEAVTRVTEPYEEVRIVLPDL